MKNRPVGKIIRWMMALGVVCVLVLFGPGIRAQWWSVLPPGQPDQMRSKVDYDPKLTDPFFKANEWSYPQNIIKHPDGHFEDTSSDKRPEQEPLRLKHTAKCFSTPCGAYALTSVIGTKVA